MDYRFKVASHSDMIFAISDEDVETCVNMGNMYHLGFPALLWLVNLHLKRPNLFENIEDILEDSSEQLYGDQQSDVDEVVKAVEDTIREIHLGNFNEDGGLGSYGLMQFSSGSHDCFYEFRLEENLNLLETNRRKMERGRGYQGRELILSIPNEDLARLTTMYFDFARENEKWGNFKVQVDQLVRKLRSFEI
jgi:hypothetical protein